MSQSHEIHKLVISNMAVLEQAPAVVDEAEKRIFGAIDEKIEKWVKAQEGWVGLFGFLEDKTSFKPASWPIADDDGYLAWFEIGMLSGENYHHNLSALVGAVPQEFGFFFILYAPWLTGLENQKRAQPGRKWANFLNEHFSDFPLLTANGFRPEVEMLFHPVRIDAAALADAYPDTLDDALEPVDEALAHIAAALLEFTRLIETAQAHFAKNGEDAAQA